MDETVAKEGGHEPLTRSGQVGQPGSATFPWKSVASHVDHAVADQADQATQVTLAAASSLHFSSLSKEEIGD